MRIKVLSYRDNKSGWNINKLCFNGLTLLVGASGVGKTQILESILNLKSIASGDSRNGVEWEISFDHDHNSYVWTGAFSVSQEEDSPDVFGIKRRPVPILREYLSCNGDSLVERTSESIIYNGKETVRLDVNKSIVELLKEEASVMPVHKAFEQVFRLRNESLGIRIGAEEKESEKPIQSIQFFHQHRYYSPVEKLFLLKKNSLPEFDLIKDSFHDIFPLVEDIDFTVGQLFDDTTFPLLKIKEKHVESWILQRDISSGMFRTLVQIIELALAQSGDVILIDEFENGLGVNCLDKLADLIKYPEQDIQVILTSHHPYIINVIPLEQWKIVARKGSNVRVYSAKDLHIGNHSRHDAFMQLIQTAAYKTGEA